MSPGDRQDFELTIDRKIAVPNSKGQIKLLEVGKYNFRLVPTWSTGELKSAPKIRKVKITQYERHK